MLYKERPNTSRLKNKMSHLRVFVPGDDRRQRGRGLGGVLRNVGSAVLPLVKKQLPAVRRVLKRRLKKLARRGLRAVKRRLSQKGGALTRRDLRPIRTISQKGGALKRTARTPRRTTRRQRTIGRARDIFS